MRLNIYDNALNRIAIIDENYVSCLWVEGYNTVESFTLELVNTEEYRQKVRPGVYVGRTDRNTLMLVESVEIRDFSIVATGKSAARVLDNIAFVGTLAAGADFPSAVKTAYDNSDKVANVEVKAEISANYGEEIANKSLLEVMTVASQGADVGFRAVRGDGAVNVEFYRPSADPKAIYAEKYGNLVVESLNFSNAKYKNYCIVLGQDKEDAIIRVDVDNRKDGEAKREIIVESSQRWEDEDTAGTYNAKLRAEGAETLAEHKRTFVCAIKPHAGDFGTRYDIGDVLTIMLPQYGLKLQARVMRVTQKAQKNATETTVEVGEITIIKR